MKKTLIDFETYYDKTVSVTTLGLDNYAERADAYIVSIVDEGLQFCGTIAQAREAGLDKIALDPNREIWAANSNFDQRFWSKYFGPSVKPWQCVLDRAAYHQLPRALDGVCRTLLHTKMDKSVRDEMKGVVYAELPDADQQRVNDYCLNDSIYAKAALDALPPMSPVEEQLAAHTRMLNRRGIHINVEKVQRDISLLEALNFDAFKKIPWTAAGGKPTSYNEFSEWCYNHGQKPPASLDKRDQICTQWVQDNPELAPTLGLMRLFNGTNAKLKKLKTVIGAADDNNRIPLELLYCAARHTRRWSAKTINVQNLDAKRVFQDEMADLPFFQENPDELPGIDMREYFIPPPGKKFGILDFTQVEPRCLNWLINNEPMLAAMRAGYGIYEAHAKATMKWSGAPGTLKKEFPDKYKFAKMRVIALGYGMGVDLFRAKAKTDIGVDLTQAEAKAHVTDFRMSNPLITGLWKRMDGIIRNAAYDPQKSFEVEMPTGDLLKYFTVRSKGFKKGYEGYTTRGDFGQGSHQPRLWGGTLTENVIQRIARDILGEAILRLEGAGFPVVFHAHDEVVLALDEATAKEDLEEAKRVMSVVPEWCAGVPLGVDGDVHDHYVKLA